MEIKIVQERIFGSTCIQKEILKVREDILHNCGVYEELPITYIQGQPFWGTGFAGLQICAVKSSQPHDNVWTIYEDKIPCGRGWNRNGTTFLSLQNIHGLKENQSMDNSREEQTGQMFDRANKLLHKHGASFQNVVRTQIYISDILDWYEEFNNIRNAKYTEFGLIPTKSDGLVAEQIYLPASTGIQADNPLGTIAVMDILAVIKGPDAPLEIMHNTGIKQSAPYRYGSAFSRSTIIRELNNKCIFLSGTASIDEHGKSLFINNIREQIRKTFEIIDALISKEGASLQDIHHSSVFLKRQEDASIYQEVVNEYGLADMPSVCVIADICRDELLFEIDALVAIENTNRS
jgi:enamine deaminase RidA (YjgF/YER057c/UK114 family)